MASYLSYISNFGFTKVHIWVEPPKPFDEYIFFGRPMQDKKVMERNMLRSWYNKMLELAQSYRIVEKFNNMYEEYNCIKSVREIPIFKGDQWEVTLQELAGKVPQQSQSVAQSQWGAAGMGGKRSAYDLNLSRNESDTLLKQAKKSMQNVSDHFLVATLKPVPAGRRKQDIDPIISYHGTNKREDFLELCIKNNWEFRSLKHARYSTMMICHHLKCSPKPDQCKDTCTRGRVDDGYGMVGCDGPCNQWYHYECVGLTAHEVMSLGSWLCDECKFQTLMDQGDYDDLFA